MMERWVKKRPGIMEWWNIGMMGSEIRIKDEVGLLTIIPLFQHSMRLLCLFASTIP
jgi:hypothetical protein